MKGTNDENMIESIETLIDKIGIDKLVVHLTEICYLKEEHLRVNWQDKLAGDDWGLVGRHLDKTPKIQY